MLKFTEIKKAINVAFRAAITAGAGLAVGVAHNVAHAEHSPAPYFTYEAVATGPIESRRAEYVALRDAILRLPVASAERADLQSRLDAIPIEEKWRDGFKNLVTTAGKNDILTNQFKGSSYTAAWYLGLIDNASFSTVAAGDTMGSHAGWIEAVGYSSANRPPITFGTASAGSLAASAVAFSINSGATINGAFSVTNSTKSGTTGVLYSAGSFASTRTVANGDTLNVTLTVTA